MPGKCSGFYTCLLALLGNYLIHHAHPDITVDFAHEVGERVKPLFQTRMGPNFN